ncbi:unnamed protein product [Darwinula stevensoni]|uniref:Ribosomal protein S14 n=1 Tax=Darwinula stevensoni TaxID=69355 RepID=A0A7R8X1S9_9CRUS|nr:unnamed protein product [Darwinula stevensoni]CAG0880433.1 unnamed protein product [Darwinula stevensoni]
MVLKLRSCSLPLNQVIRTAWRLHWPNWKTVKDQKIRMLVKQHGREKRLLDAMTKNDILPEELRDIAMHHIKKDFEKNTSVKRINDRCQVTGRPRGVVVRWRLSRIVFRHEVDYNKMSGVMRGKW